MKLALIVGHTSDKQGASMVIPYNFVSEYKYNTVLAGIIKSIATRKGCECGVFFRDKVGVEGAYEAAGKYRPSGIVELHFNAASAISAKGSETLFGHIVGSNELAKYVHAQISVAMVRNKSSDRGCKQIAPEDRGGSNVNNKTGIPSILVEPFFGSNPDECGLALEAIPELAEAIVNGFMFWWQGIVKDCKDVH